VAGDGPTQSSPLAVFAAIPVQYTVAARLLESLLESLPGNLFEACLRAFFREPRIGRSRVFHRKLLAYGKL
jgi:hypothetical protein